MADRFDEERARQPERNRARENDRGQSDRYDDRGLVQRAGDEVRSWFGDDDAARRRDRDDMRDRERNVRDDRNEYGGRGWGDRGGYDRPRPQASQYSGPADLTRGASYGGSDYGWESGVSYGSRDSYRGDNRWDRNRGDAGRDRLSDDAGRDRSSEDAGRDRFSQDAARDRFSGDAGRDRFRDDAGHFGSSYSQQGYARQGYEPQRFQQHDADPRNRDRDAGYGNRNTQSFGSSAQEYRRFNPGSLASEYEASQPAWRGRNDELSGHSGSASSWNARGPHTGRGPRGYQRSDDRIREDICDRLTHHGDIDATDIRVTVSSGNVTLDGSVDSRHGKRLAEDVAESVSGVRDVTNHIKTEQRGEREGREGNPQDAGIGHAGTPSMLGLSGAASAEGSSAAASSTPGASDKHSASSAQTAGTPDAAVQEKKR